LTLNLCWVYNLTGPGKCMPKTPADAGD
jgi:hypothetical protein